MAASMVLALNCAWEGLSRPMVEKKRRGWWLAVVVGGVGVGVSG